jgi:hypothetical protein
MLSVNVSYINLYNYPHVSIQNLILSSLWLSIFIHKKPKVYPFLSGDVSIHIRWFNLLYPLISPRFSCWVSDPDLGCSGLSRLLLDRTWSSTGKQLVFIPPPVPGPAEPVPDHRGGGAGSGPVGIIDADAADAVGHRQRRLQRGRGGEGGGGVAPASGPSASLSPGASSQMIGTPFLCMQLSGVRLVGSKVLNEISETSMCWWDVGYNWRNEGASQFESQTKHHPTNNIEISDWVKLFQRFNPEWIAATAQTQSSTSNITNYVISCTISATISATMSGIM